MLNDVVLISLRRQNGNQRCGNVVLTGMVIASYSMQTKRSLNISNIHRPNN